MKLRSRPRLRRLLGVTALVAALLPLYWRSPGPFRASHDGSAHVIAKLAYPSASRGDVRLGGVWELTFANKDLAGFSALIADGSERLTAYADNGFRLSFDTPARPTSDREQAIGDYDPRRFEGEAAAVDPGDGTTWIAIEGSNEIRKFSADGTLIGRIAPNAMAQFAFNGGAEAMTRLPDGRFIILAEASAWNHPMERVGLLFATDPLSGTMPVEFRFRPPPGFDPTEMAALPDGRVLVLLRRFAPSLSGLFSSRILIADSREIAEGKRWPWQELADLDELIPRENYEGMAVVPGQARTTIWLISDANTSARLQRTLMVKLEWREGTGANRP